MSLWDMISIIFVRKYRFFSLFIIHCSLGPAARNELCGRLFLRYFLLQVLLDSRARMGKISRRPASMSKLSTSLDRML